jgi:DNA-3-methyladenine glycosylase II
MPSKLPPSPSSDTVCYRPIWWGQACEFLIQQDAFFDEIIRQSEQVSWRRPMPPLPALVRAVLGQQISVKAAGAIWGRLLQALELDDPSTLTALALLQRSPEELRELGCSKNKIITIHLLAEHSLEFKWTDEFFVSRSNDEIIEHLTPIPGIGRWTADMFLLFTLHRPDVLPYGDLGFRQAMTALYPDTAGRLPQIRTEAERWQPFGSAATWCLWQFLNLDGALRTKVLEKARKGR